MKDKSARQISAWEKSRVTVCTPDGFIEDIRELGEAPLRSLFIEGFSLKGKIQVDGTQRVMTAAGREIVIHSKSLGTALRKRAKQHQWTRSRYLSDALPEMAKMIGVKNGIQWLQVQQSPVYIDADTESAAERYILHLSGTKEKHIFRRETWNAPLEYLGKK